MLISLLGGGFAARGGGSLHERAVTRPTTPSTLTSEVDPRPTAASATTNSKQVVVPTSRGTNEFLSLLGPAPPPCACPSPSSSYPSPPPPIYQPSPNGCRARRSLPSRCVSMRRWTCVCSVSVRSLRRWRVGAVFGSSPSGSDPGEPDGPSFSFAKRRGASIGRSIISTAGRQRFLRCRRVARRAARRAFFTALQNRRRLLCCARVTRAQCQRRRSALTRAIDPFERSRCCQCSTSRL